MLGFTKVARHPFERVINRDLREIIDGNFSDIDYRREDAATEQVGDRRPSIAHHVAGLTTDVDNKIVTVSPSFERHTGFSLAECVGKGPSFLQGAQSSASALAQFQSLVLTRKQGTVTVVNYRKSGEPFLNEVMIFPMHDSHGSFAGFISMHGLL